MKENLSAFLKHIKQNLYLVEDDLKLGLTLFSAHTQTDFDRLAIILHLIMIQARFIPVNSDDFISITKENFHIKLSYNQIEPIHSNKSEQLKNNLIIILVKTSSTKAVVTLKHEKFLSSFLDLELKIDNLDLKQVTNDFKSKVLNPFKFAFRDHKLINGLSDLPVELQFRLVNKYLDIRSFTRLIQTSRYFNDLFNSTPNNSCESVWFHLFRRDWDKHDSLKKEWVTTNSGINFRSDYIKNYRRKLREDSLFYPSRSFRNF